MKLLRQELWEKLEDVAYAQVHDQVNVLAYDPDSLLVWNPNTQAWIWASQKLLALAGVNEQVGDQVKNEIIKG